MSTETVTHEHEHCEHKHSHHHNNGGGAVYGLGFIGAAIYFIGQATTFWLGVLGFLKAIVWPVFLVLGLMKFIGL
jgi:hypothetical protein